MQKGIQLVVAMWVLTGLSLALVIARLYTRIRIVKFVGAEDWMYAMTGVFLLAFTVFIQVSVHYGLGQNFWQLSVASSSDAIFWTYVANSFAITGNAMAKLSMGLFLLRVVQVKWQRIALWFAVAITSMTSIALTIMLWNQTTPIRASWDPLRVQGKWHFQIKPLSVGLGVWSSACDFFFAVFPWLFIWSLRMPQREKIMLASGMSLGVIAGACGIIRTVVLARLDVFNYTLNFVPYFAWAGAEIAVAIVCVGIPTLRPLYLRTRGLPTSSFSNRRNSNSLPQFTMIKNKETGALQAVPRKLERDGPHSPRSPRIPEKAYMSDRRRRSGSEEVLMEEGRWADDRREGSKTEIWVKKEVRVREDDAIWPLKD